MGHDFTELGRPALSTQTRTPRAMIVCYCSLYSARVQKPPLGPIARDGKTLAMVDTGTADLHGIGEPMGTARAARRVL